MRARTALLTLVLSLVPVASAAAEPSRSGSVGAGSPSYAWDGGPGTSLGANLPVLGGASVGNFVGCFEGIADCEDTLIKVEDAGTLTVTAKADDTADDVLDLYLWPSDSTGTYDDSGTDLGEGAGAQETGDEKITVPVKPGYFVAQVKFFLADGDTYKGAAVLSGFAAPAPAPAATPTPTPVATPTPTATPAPASKPATTKKKTSKRKACMKKAKKVKKKSKRAKALKRCRKLRK